MAEINHIIKYYEIFATVSIYQRVSPTVEEVGISPSNNTIYLRVLCYYRTLYVNLSGLK